MSTGKSIEERLQIIHEIFLVIGHHPSIIGADGPKLDCFHLVKVILEDSFYSCTTRQRLFSVLRKSPVWSRVLPFLRYADSTCAHKGCHHHWEFHNGPTKNCISTNYNWDQPGLSNTPCQCNGYVPKNFK